MIASSFVILRNTHGCQPGSKHRQMGRRGRFNGHDGAGAPAELRQHQGVTEPEANPLSLLVGLAQQRQSLIKLADRGVRAAKRRSDPRVVDRQLVLAEGQGRRQRLDGRFVLTWDLFGTTLYRIDIGIMDARFVWLMAVGAIVVGHVLATWLAHETALAVFGTPKAARRSQGPMLVLMVGYTVRSLWSLSQPIVEP
jgi:hypothetical protein